jgi:hypothetical protein
MNAPSRCRGEQPLPLSVRGVLRLRFGGSGAGLPLRDVHSFRERESARPPLGFRGTGRHDDVMDHGARTGTYFDCLHPFVFSEVRRDLEILVFDEAVGRHFVINRQLEDSVGLAE